jgi:hypothetical protein
VKARRGEILALVEQEQSKDYMELAAYADE